MSPSKINLDLYKDEIIQLYHNSPSTEDIPSYLLRRHNIQVSVKTIKRRLGEWGISKRIRTDDSPRLRARISALFFECCASDKEILYILGQEGYQIGKWGLISIRKQLGLNRRVSRFNREEADKKLSDAVQEELNKGTIDGYGRGYLYHHFRNQMHIVSR
jgi:Clr5 domain